MSCNHEPQPLEQSSVLCASWELLSQGRAQAGLPSFLCDKCPHHPEARTVHLPTGVLEECLQPNRGREGEKERKRARESKQMPGAWEEARLAHDVK